jgi:hypothetical protein
MNKPSTTPNCAEPDTLDVFCKRLVAALGELKMRLHARYERRFPGQGSRIREAIEEAEVSARHTPFPHLFLPDLAEEAIARLAVSLNSEVEMTLLLSRISPKASKAKGSTKSRRSNQCTGNRFFVSAFWLSPQVCFLPCLPDMDGLL